MHQAILLLSLLVRSSMEIMFFASGVWKLRHRWRFVESVLTWRVFSPGMARRLSIGLPISELVASILAFSFQFIRLPRTQPTFPLVVLLVGFLIGQMLIFARTRGANCGCSSHSGVIGPRTIARTGGLLGLALLAGPY